jgi:tripartite-type tricarboxylate transporter receptor subunit TctC
MFFTESKKRPFSAPSVPFESGWLFIFANVVAIVATLAFIPREAHAQDYPNKPVKFVVGSPAGGVVDIRARQVGARLAEQLKQPILVDNKPGASNTIAADYVAKSAPDGYTALFGGSTELVTVPALGVPIKYDAVKDFIPVAQIGQGYPVFVVNAGMGIKTLPDLITWAKARPGQLLCATAGHGTDRHFACELLARNTNISLRTVPYKGSAPMLVDIASGQVHIAIAYLAEVDKQYIQTGKLIPIGVLAPKRNARFPDLPTMGEMGYTGLELRSWTGVFVPAGTPNAVVTRLNAEIIKVVREPDYVALMAETGGEVVTPTPEQFRDFVHAEKAKWKKMSDDFGIKADQ